MYSRFINDLKYVDSKIFLGHQLLSSANLLGYPAPSHKHQLSLAVSGPNYSHTLKEFFHRHQRIISARAGPAGILMVVIIAIAASTLLMMGTLTRSNQVNELILEITYSGHYEVRVIENDELTKNSYFGIYRTTLVRESKDTWVISVWAKKTEANNELLSIQLMQKDGKVLASESNYEPYGEVVLSVVID